MQLIMKMKILLNLLMHLFFAEGFKQRRQLPQSTAVQLAQLALPQTRPLLKFVISINENICGLMGKPSTMM
jgi:hypothetical protein